MKSKNKKNRKDKHRSNEIKERKESDQGELLYPHHREQEQQSASGGSYSEQIDVTPPQPHEFPAFGNAKGDFVSRRHGRTTGRMIGHEPGTEGN